MRLTVDKIIAGDLVGAGDSHGFQGRITVWHLRLLDAASGPGARSAGIVHCSEAFKINGGIVFAQKNARVLAVFSRRIEAWAAERRWLQWV